MEPHLIKGLSAYQGKRVVVSGHTGFKGSWLCFILKWLGAEVVGYSISEPTDIRHSYFALGIEGLVAESTSTSGDVRDASYGHFLRNEKPDFVFHLAAQAIVSNSFLDPFGTISTNTFGVLNLIEYIKSEESPPVTVVVTSDKCYKNLGVQRAYMEDDILGGDDPYSASKAAAEILFHAYSQNFFLPKGVGIATARAGNVFGGGDWSDNRLIPDCMRQILSDKKISLRMPLAVRPWTLVHDILTGYLLLGIRLQESPAKFIGSWNFASGEVMTVQQITEILANYLDSLTGSIEITQVENIIEEHPLLQIDAGKAKSIIGWGCRYGLTDSLHKTAEWYYKQSKGEDMQVYSTSFLTTFFAK